MYPYHRHPVYLSRASPAIERDLVSVTSDTNWSSRRSDFAADSAGDDDRRAGLRIEWATASAPDWSKLTTNLDIL